MGRERGGGEGGGADVKQHNVGRQTLFFLTLLYYLPSMLRVFNLVLMGIRVGRSFV